MSLDFPFYKFSRATKPTWKSRFFKMLLYLFILYLACIVLLERNRRLRKTVYDFLHDHEVAYHQMRLMRFLVLPVFKFYDLSKFHTTHCVVQNPFKPQGSFFICDNFYCYSPLYEYLCSGFTVPRKNRKNLACKSKSCKVRKLRKRSYRLGKSQEKIPFFWDSVMIVKFAGKYNRIILLKGYLPYESIFPIK